MEKILLNSLLFLGVVWMLLGIVYFCIQIFQFRQKGEDKKEGSAAIPPPKETKKEESPHVLVGRSKAFIAPSFPKIPADCTRCPAKVLGFSIAF